MVSRMEGIMALPTPRDWYASATEGAREQVVASSRSVPRFA